MCKWQEFCDTQTLDWVDSNCILIYLSQFIEMLVRNLKEALKTAEFENARMIVSRFHLRSQHICSPMTTRHSVQSD